MISTASNEGITLESLEDIIWLDDEISKLPCNRCGGDVIEFSVKNDIRNAIIRPDGKEMVDEYICMCCWKLAKRYGEDN